MRGNGAFLEVFPQIIASALPVKLWDYLLSEFWQHGPFLGAWLFVAQIQWTGLPWAGTSSWHLWPQALREGKEAECGHLVSFFTVCRLPKLPGSVNTGLSSARPVGSGCRASSQAPSSLGSPSILPCPYGPHLSAVWDLPRECPPQPGRSLPFTVLPPRQEQYPFYLKLTPLPFGDHSV